MENHKIIGLVLIIIGIGFIIGLIFGLSYLGPVIGVPCIIGGIFFSIGKSKTSVDGKKVHGFGIGMVIVGLTCLIGGISSWGFLS